MNDKQRLNDIFSQFRIKANCTDFQQFGGSCYYDISLLPGERIKTINKYINEISLLLKAPSSPKLEAITNEGIIRLEYTIPRTSKINLFEYKQTLEKENGQLSCLIGENVRGKPVWFDIAQAPHTLLAGTTSSGKSTILHSIIANLLQREDVKLELIDPKNIEFSSYHSFSERVNISYNYNECLAIVNKLYNDMDFRYSTMSKGNLLKCPFQYNVLIIDEVADLIMQDRDGTLCDLLCRLAQKSRAAKIHLILTTQRPSVNIINGAIKSNFPARIACKVASGIDSRIILDCKGAETLNGNGDAIINTSEHNFERFQAAYTTAREVVEYLS